MDPIHPKNLTAQVAFRARGNPPSSQPASAIGNCFPGLEFDFRAVWRRILEGITLHEARPEVVAVDGDQPPEIQALAGQFLVSIDGTDLWVQRQGPNSPGGPPASLGGASLEWANVLATVVRRGGQTVPCVFFDFNTQQASTVDRVIRHLFTRDADGGELPVIDPGAAPPGELTQGLCSPWQNDYLECACYYWAASRPDFVNAEPDPAGGTTGHNWLHRDRDENTPLGYSLRQADLLTYEELFQSWETVLRFVIGGRDAE